ncbi:MAG: IS3 family transposase [Chloroflexota bacterium]
MSPQARRNAVNHLIAKRDYSQRRACQLVGISRSSVRYQPVPKPEEISLRQQVRQLAYQHPGYGYRRIAVILRRGGSSVNHKRVQRIWQAEGLQLPRRKPRKRRCGPRGEVVHKAQYRNHVWSYDFLEEHTVRGKRLRILAVIDEFTRECLALLVDRSITSSEVVDLLDWLFLIYGKPEFLRSDNGPELVAHKVQDWLAEQGCQTIYISPGSPWENAYIESFIGKFRKECVDRYLFYTMKEARSIIEDWQNEYNQYRPHSALGYLPPSAFAAQQQLPLPDQQETITV